MSERVYIRQAGTDRVPWMSDVILRWSQERATEAGGAGTLQFSIPFLPKSLNHQYVRRGKGASYDLHEDTKRLRDEIWCKLRNVRYRPIGVLGAVIIFRSPNWLTKERTVRDVDIDNKVKPLMDAFELATKIRDSRFFSISAFKEFGLEDRTELSVFDLGDIVG